VALQLPYRERYRCQVALCGPTTGPTVTADACPGLRNRRMRSHRRGRAQPPALRRRRGRKRFCCPVVRFKLETSPIAAALARQRARPPATYGQTHRGHIEGNNPYAGPASSERVRPQLREQPRPCNVSYTAPAIIVSTTLLVRHAVRYTE
jgi:hypothetical protein